MQHFLKMCAGKIRIPMSSYRPILFLPSNLNYEQYMLDRLKLMGREGQLHTNHSFLGQSPQAVLASLLNLSFILLTLFPSCAPSGAESENLTVDFSIVRPITVERTSTKGHLSVYPIGSDFMSYVHTLDVFMFNDDGLRKLDSYQRYDRPSRTLSIASTAGDKIVVAVANPPESGYSVRQVGTYDALEHLMAHLYEDDPEFPLMTGEGVVAAGGRCTISLEPMMSEVVLNSVLCDFSGKPYSGELLENARVYLTNVNASAEILRQDGFKPLDILNAGRLSERDMEQMACPSAVVKDIYTGIGASRHAIGAAKRNVGVTLYAYPNDVQDESIGTPYTRLVLEGTVGGEKTYYPLNINRPGWGYSDGRAGVGRNARYIFDLAITRKGSSDPDIPVYPGDNTAQGWMTLYPGNFITARDGEDVHIWCDMFPSEADLDICKEDLDYDVSRGIYTYDFDPDGHGVTLHCLRGGTGMFTIDAGPPIDTGYLVIVVVNP